MNNPNQRITPDRDRFSGCLIGQCVGDAIGFAVEGFSPAACQRYIEDFLKTGKVGEFGRFPFPFGQYSDDSQLARELMQSYVDRRQFDPADYAERIRLIFAEKRIVAFGYSTKEAVKRLVLGASWEESGTPAPSAGNGSAMRAAPVGLFFFDNPQMLIRAAHDQGRITHKDPRCSAGAIAISGAVVLALRGEKIDVGTFISTLADWTNDMEAGFSSALEKLEGWLSMPPGEAAGMISGAGFDPDYIDDEEWKGHREHGGIGGVDSGRIDICWVYLQSVECNVWAEGPGRRPRYTAQDRLRPDGPGVAGRRARRADPRQPTLGRDGDPHLRVHENGR